VLSLCSLAELQADETRGTGCNYDYEQVWSLSVCSGINGTGHTYGGHSTSIGSSGSMSHLEDRGDNRNIEVYCRPDGWTNATFARCCADSESCTPTSAPSLNTPRPTPAPTHTSPTMAPNMYQTCSAKTSTHLGWTGDAMTEHGSPGICGESDDLDWPSYTGCSGEKTWAEAVEICEGVGARLCTAKELGEDDETKGTGCNYNIKRIWSSTLCSEDSYLATFGDSEWIANKPWRRKPACYHETNATAVVRCCADEFSCTPTSVPTIVPTPAPSHKPTVPTTVPTPSPTAFMTLSDFSYIFVDRDRLEVLMRGDSGVLCYF